MFQSGMTTLIFPNEELNYIIKIIKFLENSGLLIKVVTETVENEVKEQKGVFLRMLAATLGASLLGNMSVGKAALRTREGTKRAGRDF